MWFRLYIILIFKTNQLSKPVFLKACIRFLYFNVKLLNATGPLLKETQYIDNVINNVSLSPPIIHYRFC